MGTQGETKVVIGKIFKSLAVFKANEYLST